MKSAKQFVGEAIVKEGISYVEKNPEENIPKLLNWAEKLVIREKERKVVQGFRKIFAEPENNWGILIRRIMKELSPKVRSKFLVNYMVNAGILGMPFIDKMMGKHNCNIPWAILMDPTSACNLQCTGCWAREYDKTDSLDYDTLNRIICEGKEIGTHFFLYSGGEPLLRKKDIIKLAEKHDDCIFLSFTNGTLVDEEFCEEMARVGNILLAISVEGFEEETDLRRGQGTYVKVMDAMQLLKKHGLGFGFSTCYHSKNAEVVGSDEYVTAMTEMGCMFGWYFTYIPLGKNAVPELMASAEQREYMYHRIRDMREKFPIFLMDFWNDGGFVGGCIAGARRYLHINAKGEVEPCAFIHYSNVNIKDVSLLEALKSPIFKQYRMHQPFNQNHLRPCPLLDNPDILKKMVHSANAYSTQPLDEEDVDTLTEKCQDASKGWAIKAKKLVENEISTFKKNADIV